MRPITPVMRLRIERDELQKEVYGLRAKLDAETKWAAHCMDAALSVTNRRIKEWRVKDGARALIPYWGMDDYGNAIR